jgi:Pao retrotransposon peptidase/Family of unknown function (DUF5641)
MSHQETSSSINTPIIVQHSNVATSMTTCNALLRTVNVFLQDVRGAWHTLRALLDEDPDCLLDPLLSILLKLFVKKVWNLPISWIEDLSAAEISERNNLTSTMPELLEIRIPQHASISCYSVQLHDSPDASSQGYGAVVYVFFENADGRRVCYIICSKSCIAPDQQTSIARLELCSAVELAHLMTKVQKAFTIAFTKKVCWLDSAIALHWLMESPSQLQAFVTNRVSAVHEMSNERYFRHIRGEDNPADFISRLSPPTDIDHNQQWWHGPDILTTDENTWLPSIVEIDGKDPNFPSKFTKVQLSTTVSQSSSPTINPFLRMIDGNGRTSAIEMHLVSILRIISNPRSQITPTPASNHTGVDYAGPLNFKLFSTLNAKVGINHTAHFACFSTKAIHQKVVSALTAKAFLCAFDRFTTRRSLLKTMNSDHGSSFKGVSNDIRGIFNYSFRPLTAINDDSNSFNVLTLKHLLIGRLLAAKSDRDHADVPHSRIERWNRIDQFQQHRWSHTSHHQLQVRFKHTKENPVAVEHFILVHDDSTPPLRSPHGLSMSIYSVKDEITRVASIITAKGRLEHPDKMLAILPRDDDAAVQTSPAEDVHQHCCC